MGPIRTRPPRFPAYGHGVYDVQGVRLDPVDRRVWVRDVEVTFSRKEFDLLCALISRAGQIVSRDDLMQEVWNTTFYTSSKTIDVHLGWVRRKLGDDTRRPTLITTHRGKGLRFETGPGGTGASTGAASDVTAGDHWPDH